MRREQAPLWLALEPFRNGNAPLAQAGQGEHQDRLAKVRTLAGAREGEGGLGELERIVAAQRHQRCDFPFDVRTRKRRTSERLDSLGDRQHRQPREHLLQAAETPPFGCLSQSLSPHLLGRAERPDQVDGVGIRLRASAVLGELLDLTSATDFVVLAAIKSLLDKGIARLAPELEVKAVGPLLMPAALHALRRARELLAGWAESPGDRPNPNS